MLYDLHQIAKALSGDVVKGHILCPGPGHSAVDRSLSVKIAPDAPDGFLVHSFAGDDAVACRDYVRAKCGLPEFKPNGRRASNGDVAKLLQTAITAQRRDGPRGLLVATFGYVDENGTLLYQVVKYENPKTFRQRRPNGSGGWIWSLDDVRRVPYRLPEILQYPDATIFVCEGEKDADRVASLGHCAVTVASGKWTPDCVNALAGRDVIILQDNDPPGYKKAHEAAKQLHGVAKTTRIVLLPDRGDVSDWLDIDPRRAEKFVNICLDAPLWVLEAEAKAEAPRPTQLEPPRPTQPESPQFINMSNWDQEPIPEQDWAVPNRIPLRQCTLFTGEGAAGKSIEQLHLSAAHVLGKDWLGTMPEMGPAIYIDAEDDEATIHRRLAAIAGHYGATFADLVAGGLHAMTLAGKDAVLATASRNGKLEPTPLYRQLLQAAGDIRPKMIGIASCANVFAGNENDRPQVQQFIGMLTRMAIVANGAVVLIAHPSLAGISSNTGLSGSTQWHNAVRARFFMKGVKSESGEQPDNDLREIEFKKNQYGPVSESVVLRYTDGLFLPVPGAGTLDKAAAEQADDELFLKLLDRFSAQGRWVSHKKTSNTYAPTAFATDPDGKGKRKELAAAMNRLFTANRVKAETYGRGQWQRLTRK